MLLSLFAFGCGDSSDPSGSPQQRSDIVSARDGEASQAGSQRLQTSEADEENPRVEVAPSSQDAYQLQNLRRQFPKPKPNKAKGSSDAIEAGEEVCGGKTPKEVVEEFEADSDLEAEQAKLVAELPRYEATAQSDPSFLAGQIAATVYEMTLPEAERGYGFQGCVYALARGLEGEISGG